LADKQAIRMELQEAWQQVKGLVDSLSERDIEQPGVVEEWSVKDLLGHMAFWAQKGASDLRLLAAGRQNEIQTPGDALDVWNAREAASRKEKPPAEARAEWEASFEDALRALDETPSALLDVEVKGWPQLTRFLEDTTRHYNEHAGHIRAWLSSVETTEA
jgi:uncharacterized protein (TIGR03083 family)